MKVAWGTYPNNIGHEDFLGCFRCHDDNHKTRDGRTITQDCDACHYDPGDGRVQPRSTRGPGPAVARSPRCCSRPPPRGRRRPTRTASPATARGAPLRGRREPVRGRRKAPEERSRGARLRRLPRRHDATARTRPRFRRSPLLAAATRTPQATLERSVHGAEERWRRGAGMHVLPRQDSRVPAARRARLAGRQAQPARDLRRLPREPGVPGAARDRAGAADRGLPPRASTVGRLASGNEKAASCSDCHGSHAILGQAQDAASRRSTTGTCPATCGPATSEIATTYAGSIHGQAIARGVAASARSAPTATASTRSWRPSEPGSLVNPARVSSVTCGRCHADERLAAQYNLPRDKVPAFEDSFHGLARRAGLADASPTAPPATASTTSCRRATRARRSTPPTWPGPAAPATPEPATRFAIGAGPRARAPPAASTRRALDPRRLPLADPADDRLHAAAQRARLPAPSCAAARGASHSRGEAAAHEPALPDRARPRRAELPDAGRHRLRAEVSRCLVGGADRRLRGRLRAAGLRPSGGRARADARPARTTCCTSCA